MALPTRSREKVRADIIARLVPDGECLVWSGATFSGGYGLISHGGKHRGVHRYLWELTYGDLPQEVKIDHKCRNKACANLKHLQETTHTENMHNLGIDSNANSTGVLNVVRRVRGGSCRYYVKLASQGKTFHFGGYSTLAEAKEVAIEKRKLMYPNSFPLENSK